MAKLEAEVQIPEGIQVQYASGMLTVSSGSNTVTMEVPSRQMSITVEGNIAKLSSDRSTKRELRLVGTYKAHLKNMFKGVKEGHKYLLKICSGHFPMNVALTGNQIIIKNFLGEAVPRTVEVPSTVKVQINGTDVVVEGTDKNAVGGFAGKLEKLTRISNRDSRIFQDGIYIVEKDGKRVA